MRILLCGINFAPELTGIGKYTGDMAAWLAERGHEVRVVTAPPYYPDWRVADGDRGLRYRRSAHALGRGSLQVTRCPIWVPRRPSGPARLLHLLSFALSSAPVLFGQWRWKPELVWMVEPPLVCAPQVALFTRLCRAVGWLHVQDFEVDAAFDLGLLRGARLRGAVLAAERWLLRRFDRVSAISPQMVDRLRAKGVAADRAVLFPNWADLAAIVPQPFAADGGRNALRDALGIGPDCIVALYSGNMGAKQGLETLAAVARALAARRGVRFVFCGEGACRAELERACAGLDRVTFLALQPVARLGELLNMADIHLLPQRADAADLVLPSKLTGMLASARPVVAGARAGSGLAAWIDGCGVCVEPDDADAMARAVDLLAADRALRARLGAAGRARAQRDLDRDAVLGRFDDAARALCARAGAQR